MKFQFEPDLDYQRKAIDAVCDLFRGQGACRSEFTASHALTEQGQLGFAENDLGVGNRLALSEDALLANLQDIQLRNGLRPSSGLDSHDFSVEMETGTGKTYVYLRTIFELNKRYGFTKFAIVVPSIAIKEGVDKSLAMMRDHFRALYSGAPFEHFIYDSTQLGQVRNFATSPQIQIMVMTVGAINKRNINSIYHENEKTGGEKPIDLVRATHPILIVDEPQSVDGGLKGRGKEALETMNPLCTLRYSATHIDLHHPVYRLNAVDAYERKLVKQIEVSAGTVIDDYNRPYVRLVATRRQRGVISARVELNIKTQTGSVRRQIMVVQDGDSLERKTRYAIYHNHHIGEIRVGRGNEYLELRVPGTEHWLREGEAYGDVENRVIQRAMIRRTIHEHLEKEKGLHREGIKVLTLFFVDKVAHYRDYDEDGNAIKGEYARIFEEEYRRAANNPNYRALFEGVSDLTEAAEQVHNGYFSIDKRGGWTDTAENDQTDRDNAERAYNLIMRDKEKLLGFAEPLKFIFSHSALREGWDNPNVFQICALRDIQTERERRQTIGRGLRLCVNQAGQRQRGFEVNTLTVIARESYEDFADNLQREIEEETGTRFGTVEPHQFASIQVRGEDDQTEYLGLEQSQMLWEHFKARGYIDADQKIADALTLDAGNFVLPAHFEPLREAIAEVLRKANGRIVIKDRNERSRAHPREAVLNGEEFKALWDRIKYKTTYRVKFDNEELIKKCSETLRDAPPIPRTRLQWNAADLRIGEAGVQAKLREQSAAINLVDDNLALPDVFTELQNRTQLTRRSIQRILSASGRLDDFCVNPQKFIEIAAEAINRRKRLAVVDGIKYQRLGADAYYAQELFMSEEMTGYIKNMLVSQKSAYDHVVYDSANEAAFADQLEKNIAIKVYAKLPRWFQVPTPLGGYTPDWAVLVEDGDGERLYFVAETKSTAFLDDLRNIERAKVACGRAHFSALKVGESPIEYRVVHTLDELMADEEKK